MEYHDNAHKELLVAWLNDAYATEKALVPVMENHIKDFKDYPQAQMRLQQHLEETRRHADMIAGCIDHLGEDVSTMKSGWGSFLGSMKSVSTGMFQDELIKNCLSDYAAECFEIACYKSLISAAQLYGDQEVVQVCQEILQDEENMAQWLDQNIPMVTQEVMRMKVHTE